MQSCNIWVSLNQVLKCFGFSLQLEDASLHTYEETALEMVTCPQLLPSWTLGLDPSTSPISATSTILPVCMMKDQPTMLFLIHPSVLEFSATWFFHILKAWLAATFFSLTVLPTCDIPNQFGLESHLWMPGLCAPVSCVVLVKLLIQKPSHGVHLIFPWTSLLTFPYLLTSYFPGFTQGAFPLPWLHLPLV